MPFIARAGKHQKQTACRYVCLLYCLLQCCFDSLLLFGFSCLHSIMTRAVVCQAPSKKLSSILIWQWLDAAEGHSQRKKRGNKKEKRKRLKKEKIRGRKKKKRFFLPLGFRHALCETPTKLENNTTPQQPWHPAELQPPANTLSPPETQAPPTRTSRI